MKSLYPVLRLWALAYYKRALKEMGADHPDVPHVVLKINQLESS